MENQQTKAKLLDAASALLQTRGYKGFSFHDLAATVGIRTSSIHYHFPTKASLVQSLVQTYTSEFLRRLGPSDHGSPRACLRHYIELFRGTLADRRMCLCGMIAAEADGIPPEVVAEVSNFFKASKVWLAAVFRRSGDTSSDSRRKAVYILSSLEGAMILSRAEKDFAAFDHVASNALAMLRKPLPARSRRPSGPGGVQTAAAVRGR